MTQSKDFRENASRAVFITGDIDERLVQRLTPDICRLRGESSEPITAYINSRGGFTYCAEQIRALLTAPNQDGEVCRILTVATSRADSAAAGLLALGDYAIAYPSATVHCHGTRLSDEEITSERAEWLAASLKRTNDEFALRLARKTFARMAFHFANLRGEFPQIREQAIRENWDRKMSSDLECFACALHSRLSPELSELPAKAFGLHERLAEMADTILANLNSAGNEPWGKVEADILKRLIDFELNQRDPDKWTLSAGGIDELALDFKSLTDFLFGPHRESLEDRLDSFGALFLEPSAITDYQARRDANPREATEWLRNVAKPIVEPMWFFVVSLCRLLQAGEYGLSATDAYWLGIVDEVVSERLPSFRLIAENP